MLARRDAFERRGTQHLQDRHHRRACRHSGWRGNPRLGRDISCAWNNLPTAVREEFERLARSSQPEKSLGLIDNPSMVGAIKACKFKTEPGDRLVMAMGGLLNQ